jgi:nicotinamidase/pyrazinamidase
LFPTALISKAFANRYGSPSATQLALEIGEMGLVSPKTILWEVDVQADFMLPGGRLYIPGAEMIIANINRLVDCARKDRGFLISSADAHNPDDLELRDWPPHCLKGTPGADLLPEACASPRLVIPNKKGFVIPQDFLPYRQVMLEKNSLDVFDNPNTKALLARMSPACLSDIQSGSLFIVFGVATEYCVSRTAEGLLCRGHSVAVVNDAVRAIDEKKAQHILEDLRSRGAQLISTNEALAVLTGHPNKE